MFLRSLCSTLVIAIVAFSIIDLRSARFDPADLLLLATANWRFLIALYLALAISDYWFLRTARSRNCGGDDAECR